MTDDVNLQSAEGMDDQWLDIKETGGVAGAESRISYPEEGYDYAELTAIRNDYRWTPACQRMFLEELACFGSVTHAAKFVEKSIRAAYCLRFRRDGTAFRLGWDAAILVARDRLSDMLMDRAVCGYEEFTQKEEDGTRRRGKFDNRLSSYMMGRLDRIAEREALAGTRDRQVQLVVQDFESFLDLIGRGGTGADAALFFAAVEPMECDRLRSEIDNELAQFSADERAQADDAGPEFLMEEEPEKAVARMRVWWDEKWGGYCTNFPLSPEDRKAETLYRALHEKANIRETGDFGHRSYCRALTPDEREAYEAQIMRDLAPWIDAANTARDAWFGEKLAA